MPVAVASVAVTARSGRAPVTRWLVSAAIPVSPMITSDVPTARRNGVASQIVSTGTITNPPPTPKNPVSAPTSSPATTHALERRVRAVAVLAPLPRAPPGQRGRGEHQRHEREDQRVAR